MSQSSLEEKYHAMMAEDAIVSDWMSISQDEVNRFGRLTRDIDPQHMDPDWAREHGLFDHTILYGFQILSMMTALTSGLRDRMPSDGHQVNYGFDKIRFISPIAVEDRFRDHIRLTDVRRREDGGIVATTEHRIEVEGREVPALVAEWLSVTYEDNEIAA